MEKSEEAERCVRRSPTRLTVIRMAGKAKIDTENKNTSNKGIPDIRTKMRNQ